jgi:hypothetical protein
VIFLGSRPLKLENVVEVLSDGTYRRHAFAEVSGTLMRLCSRATGIVTGGISEKPTPQPSNVQKAIEGAALKELLADALIYIGRAPSWFDIYKALECVEELFGGERKFLAVSWVDSDETKRLKRTANAFRHATKKFEPPPEPFELMAAHQVVASLIRRASSEL